MAADPSTVPSVQGHLQLFNTHQPCEAFAVIILCLGGVQGGTCAHPNHMAGQSPSCREGTVVK
jgi:hypothetical protein